MIFTKIIDGPLPDLTTDDNRDADGAELIFQGRVRGSEGDEAISSLRYEYYPEMADKVLQQLAEQIAGEFGIHDLFCWHRVGDVSVGEASLRVVIWSRHRKEGLDALAAFVTELKRQVPIWKWAVLPDGTSYPCGICAGCASSTHAHEHPAHEHPAHEHPAHEHPAHEHPANEAHA